MRSWRWHGLTTLKDRQFQEKTNKIRKILTQDAEHWHRIDDIRRTIHLNWVFDGNFKTFMRQLVEDELVDKDVVDKKDVYRARHGYGMDNGLGGFECVCGCSTVTSCEGYLKLVGQHESDQQRNGIRVSTSEN